MFLLTNDVIGCGRSEQVSVVFVTVLARNESVTDVLTDLERQTRLGFDTTDGRRRRRHLVQTGTVSTEFRCDPLARTTISSNAVRSHYFVPSESVLWQIYCETWVEDDAGVADATNRLESALLNLKDGRRVRDVQLRGRRASTGYLLLYRIS
jgi:hypothetical protein